MTVEEYLIEVKELLGIKDDKQDATLKFIIKTVINKIKSFCNIECIPEELDTVVISMVMDGYRNFKLKSQLTDNASNGGGEVKTIKRGDTSITYQTPSEILASWSSDKTLLNSYLTELVRYRRLFKRCSTQETCSRP